MGVAPTRFLLAPTAASKPDGGTSDFDESKLVASAVVSQPRAKPSALSPGTRVHLLGASSDEGTSADDAEAATAAGETDAELVSRPDEEILKGAETCLTEIVKGDLEEVEDLQQCLTQHLHVEVLERELREFQTGPSGKVSANPCNLSKGERLRADSLDSAGRFQTTHQPS